MDKADIALIVAGLSAAAAAASAFFTWRQSHLTQQSMKRKPIIFELADGRIADIPDGAWCFQIRARNLEPVSAIVRSIKVRRHGVKIAHIGDAHESAANPLDPPVLKKSIPWREQLDWTAQIAPRATPRHPHGISPTDSATTIIYATNVLAISDLAFDWSWMDGKKD